MMDVDKNIPVIDEEIAPMERPAPSNQENQENIQPHTQCVHRVLVLMLCMGLWVSTVEETKAFHLF